MDYLDFSKQTFVDEILMAYSQREKIACKVTDEEYDADQKGHKKDLFIVPNDTAKMHFQRLASGYLSQQLTEDDYCALLDLFLKILFPRLSKNRINLEANKHIAVMKKYK